MAQEETVQGAAKKISGLLNPEAGQSAPEKKSRAIRTTSRDQRGNFKRESTNV
jgi:hypothetical protein